ncbi:LPS export ABC transporter permease LptF [Wenxinia marina]|uniref:Putative permease n=1 Tax=Wenxinia marina DSM 24838 TaxID=1123501 RepID=A0A0D0PZV0_9RHOB|nr:LPS export ABC transporter permease LptF [Wenxinia marina]KIQ67889.1 putative permease [Wenxinia marina DSM 24838]GGL74317.1 LPS export ABC transporter permease LptF [Wenxinia marina]
MGRFDRYVLSQLLWLFGLSALVLIMVYWINRAVGLFDQIISDGQGIGVFLELTVLALPQLIGIVVPISTVIAAIYVTNRLTAESELTVVRATGFSPWRLARPFAVFGLMIALVMSVLTHVLIPAAAARLADRQDEIAENATARLLREGQFLAPVEGMTIYIRDVTPDGEIRDLFLADTREPEAQITYTATRAFLVRTDAGPQLVMIDGMVQTLSAATGRLGVTTFEELAYDVASLLPSGGDAARRPREVPTPELLTAGPDLQAETGWTEGELVAEGHERIADALLACVGALIGFAALIVGGFSRFGVWRQILLAIGLTVVVKGLEGWVTSVVAGAAGRWPLLYLPTATGAAMVLVLLTIAARPELLRRRPRREAAA